MACNLQTSADPENAATGTMPGRPQHQQKTILLIDDDVDMHTICRRYVQNVGYHLLSAYDGAQGLEIVSQGNVDLVLLDFMMPGKDGYGVYKDLTTLDEFVHVRHTPVIMLSVLTENMARKDELLSMGVSLYLNKPFGYKELVNVIENVFVTARMRDEQRAHEERQREEVQRIERENRNLRLQIQETFGLDNIIGVNPMMRDVFEKVLKVAPSDANVLIHGESGTGKELIARSIHAHGRRAKGPFVAVDCVALPVTLLESELFGYEKGAFTGASQTKSGLFELAHVGTFFLDEICELSPALQAKLLRVLQERQFRRLGGKKLIEVDVRVIAATNRDPRAAVQEGILRQDLYYRLNVIPVYLVPLRERRDDILPLANFFLRKLCHANNRPIMQLSATAREMLLQYNWPGNVRELRNAIERIVSLSSGRIVRPEDLPDCIQERSENHDGSADPSDLTLRDARRHWIEKFERKYLADLLARYNGNISQVARIAGVNRMTIYRLLRQYNISVKVLIDN